MSALAAETNMETQSWSPPKEVVAYAKNDRDDDPFAAAPDYGGVRHVGQTEAFRTFMLRASR